MSLIEHNLEMQGFSGGVRNIERALRFTPTLSLLCILTGTVLASPTILWMFALISLVGSVSESHLFDVIYNSVFRPMFKTPPLPSNPRPRRFAMLVAGIWSAVAALFFFVGWEAAGFIAGTLLAIAGLSVAATHFCLGSWMFRMFEHRKMGHV